MSKEGTEISVKHAARLQAIFEHSYDGIITIDSRGVIESINPAAARLFDYRPEEVIGKNVKVLMPEPHHSSHDTYIENYHRTQKPKIIGIGREVEGKRKDGTHFPFFLSVSETQIGEERIFTGFIHDISQLKAKEAELEASRNRLAGIFNTATDGIIIIDKKGIIHMANPAISQMFGYHEEEIVGQNISILMPEPHHSNHDQYIDNYLTSGKAKIIGIGREVEGRKKDGTLFPINLGISEVRTGEEIMFTGIIHDMTARKEAELQIRSLNTDLEDKVKKRTLELSEAINKLLDVNERLESEVGVRKEIEEALRLSEKETRMALEKEKELSELKSRFVSMASHEFRTPLSTILSSTELTEKYLEKELYDKMPKHLQRVIRSVTNLNGILDDFLSLSKLEEGRVEVNSESFMIEDLCNEVIDDMMPYLKPGQKIVAQGDPITKVITMDKRLLKNVFFNLLSNASKYSDEGKVITCDHKLENNYLSFKVIDQGIGIPEEDQQHLFTRFFRANNAMNIQGTGLGLNIVRRYLDLLGGEISFESQQGKGSTFTVIIPLNN